LTLLGNGVLELKMPAGIMLPGSRSAPDEVVFVGFQSEAKETPERDMDYYMDRNSFEANEWDVNDTSEDDDSEDSGY
jgi:hypothetical protein